MLFKYSNKNALNELWILCVCNSKIFQMFCVFQLEVTLCKLYYNKGTFLLFQVLIGPILVKIRIIFREKKSKTLK